MYILNTKAGIYFVLCCVSSTMLQLRRMYFSRNIINELETIDIWGNPCEVNNFPIQIYLITHYLSHIIV